MSVDDPALSNEAQWLALVMDSVDMVLWDRDLSNNRVHTSANYGEFYGMEAGRRDWTFEEFLACVLPEDRVRLLECFHAALHSGSEYRLQFRRMVADRQVRWCETKARIQRDAQGQAVRVAGVTWDVTGQRASEDRLAQIAPLVPGMVYQFKRSADGRDSFPYCSEGIATLFGLRPGDVRDDASALLALVHEEDLGRLLETLDISSRALTLWRCEYRIQPSHAEPRWVLGIANPERLPDGAVLWHGYTKDITERKKAELAMREVNARLALALSTARMMTWYWDIATDEFVSSPKVDPLLNRTERNYTMTELFALMPEDDALRVRAEFERIAHESITNPVTVEFRLMLPAGRTRWIQTRARSSLDPTGQATAVLGVAIDVTRRRIVESEKEALVLQLTDTQKLESIGMLTGGIAHDFNNLLSSILGFSSLARERYGEDLPAKLVDYLAEIQAAGERGRDMIAQLLAFGRGERAAVAPADLPSLVEQTLRMVRSALPASVKLTTQFDPDLPLASTHPTQLQQILLNLCINARDAMQGAGQLQVTLREVSLSHAICASCGKPFAGRFVRLSVADSGPGIPDTVRTQIFTPFFSTKSDSGGTGLGLAMVHSLLHSHGGHIGLDTGSDSGTQFHLYFQAASRADDKVVVQRLGTRPLASATPLRALVIDDEAAVAKFFGEVLETAGQQVQVATDPQLALNLFMASPDDFDLVITDQTMPTMTGTALAQSMLALRPALPIILVSGFSADFDGEKAQDIGIRTFLRKPVSTTELLLAIANAVEDPR